MVQEAYNEFKRELNQNKISSYGQIPPSLGLRVFFGFGMSRESINPIKSIIETMLNEFFIGLISLKFKIFVELV
jgi:hypothetical protein